MTTPTRTWHQYGLAAHILYDLTSDLEDFDWEYVLAFTDAPRLDVGVWDHNGTFRESYTISVAMDQPSLTLRVGLPDGENVCFALPDNPERDDIENVQDKILAILTWDADDVVQCLLSRLRPPTGPRLGSRTRLRPHMGVPGGPGRRNRRRPPAGYALGVPVGSCRDPRP